MAFKEYAPGDELTWIDGVTYERMSDGCIAVYLPERRRRRRPSFYWGALFGH